jgi:4-aminobutyrate aminotransferase-like enzyme
MPELEPNPSLGALLLQRLGKLGILAHVCGHDWSVLRIEPPLIISAQQCDAFLAALDSSLEWLEQNVIEV